MGTATHVQASLFHSYMTSGENNTNQKEVTRGQKSPVRTYAGTEANSVPPTTGTPEGVGTQTHGRTKLCDHRQQRVDIPAAASAGRGRDEPLPTPDSPTSGGREPRQPTRHCRPLLFSTETGRDPPPAPAPGRFQALIPGETPLPLFGLGKLSCR